jgi:hypothetical protein
MVALQDKTGTFGPETQAAPQTQLPKLLGFYSKEVYRVVVGWDI